MRGSFAIHWGQLGLTELAQAIAGHEQIAIATSGADCERPRFIGFGLPGGTTQVLDLLDLPGLGPLSEQLRSKTLVGHDLQDLLTWLAATWDLMPAMTIDTGLIARLLDGGRHPPDDPYFALDSVVQRELGSEASAVPGAGKNSGAEHLQAAARSAEGLVSLRAKLEHAARQQQLERAVGIENQLLPAIVKIAGTGMKVDRRAWQALVDKRTKRVQQLRDQIESKLKICDARDHQLVLDGLRSAGFDVEGTGKASLALRSADPLISAILELRRLEAFICDNARAVLTALDASPDGRIRPRWHQLGCSTGRMSLSNPALLSTPKDPEVRSCFIPEQGSVFVIADYAAIELRILAQITGDARLIDIFRMGGDPHRTTAAAFANKPEEAVTDEERRRAKPVNFGLAFGMGPDTLMEYAAESFGIAMTREDAERYVAAFQTAFPGVHAWQARARVDEPQTTRTLSGRIRYLGSRSDYCARLNSPVQGTGADGMKTAVVLMTQRLPGLGARVVLIVHDEVVVEVPAEHAEAAREVVTQSMIEGMSRFVTDVPMTVTARIASSWA